MDMAFVLMLLRPIFRNAWLLHLLYSIILHLVFVTHALGGERNRKPEIVNQYPVSTNEDQSITISLDHLIVRDRDDWFYPWGFTLTVYPGTNYTLSGHTVTPALNFFGELSVPVVVNDGKDDSNVYTLKVQVNPVNDPPLITGQLSLSATPNIPFTIQFSHLIVFDPDNTYPSGFNLIVSSGANYTVSGNQITPHATFTGTLDVGVKVNDGTNESPQYILKIQVNPANSIPEIVSQVSLAIKEDESITIEFSHLTVVDNDSNYPNGFTLQLAAGNNYSINQQTITPSLNFNGTLTVPVTVNDGRNTSKPFNLLILVVAVNDPPLVSNFGTELLYSIGKGLIPITNTIEITDPDNDSLMVAEISFNAETYSAGQDELVFSNTTNIKGAFDSRSGVMALFGKAPIQEYKEAIQAVHYRNNSSTNPAIATRKLYLTISDGASKSAIQEKLIRFTEGAVELDIPTAFSPNGDAVNDTWKIKPLQRSPEEYDYAVVRVYSRRGELVYEGTGLRKEWDGKYNGNMLPPDVYFYVIEFNSLYTKSSFKGALTILR